MSPLWKQAIGSTVHCVAGDASGIIVAAALTALFGLPMWLDLIVEYFRGRPGVEVLSTSAGQGDGSPIAFYERYGFERTGDIVFNNEVLLRLRLSQRSLNRATP